MSSCVLRFPNFTGRPPGSFFEQLLPGLADGACGLVQRFGDHAGIGEHGHEIGVSDPPGHEVGVNVVFDSGSGSGSDIEAEIETVRVHEMFERLFAAGGQAHDLGHFFEDEGIEIADMPIGGDHEMPGIVGEVVEQDETMPAAGQDVIFSVSLGGFAFPAEEAAGAFRSADVLDAPRGPKGAPFGGTGARGVPGGGFLGFFHGSFRLVSGWRWKNGGDLI